MSIWSGPDRSGLLAMDALSFWSDRDSTRRIVWMINRMIKQQAAPDRVAVGAFEVSAIAWSSTPPLVTTARDTAGGSAQEWALWGAQR